MHPRPQPTTGAEAFARMLDGVGEVRSWDVADLDDLSGLVALTRQIAQVEAPLPRAEFSANLRAQLLAADPVTPREPERPVIEAAAEVIDLAASRQRRATKRAFTAAAIGSLVLGTAGMAAASQSALPGSPLYGVKRAIEGIELSFATNDSARAHDYLDQARTRLTEVQELAKTNDSSNTALIQQALQAFSSSASKGTNLLFSNYQRSGNTADLAEIQRFASAAANQLNTVSPTVVSQNRAQMLEASSLIANVDQQSKMLCPTCEALPPLPEQVQQLAAASNNSGNLSPLLSLSAASMRASAPITPPASSNTTTSTPATPATPQRTTAAPKHTAPATPPAASPVTGLGQTLSSVLTPVTSTVGGVLPVVTGTVGGVTNTVTGLLGGLLSPKN